jgi:hypothetical protein
MATGLSAEEIGAMLPRDIPALWEAVAKVNDFLLKIVRGRMAASEGK